MDVREVVLVFVCVFCFGIVTANAPKIIDRSGWGAKSSSKPQQSLAQNPVPYVIIHHSVTEPCNDEASCKRMVKVFQNDHMTRNHWDDIGYNFLIGGDGSVYEGRGWGKSGAHTRNYNNKSIGICVIGNYQSTLPKKEALDALKDLIAWGVSQGQINGNYKLLGHKQVAASQSPGAALYNEIKTWEHWSASP
ncbi:hypothetical protein PPYR_04338 [Photinus pyralis]|uniref:Peptidoglycan-recognition protein n=2 Tax=Photinus pyralis TaxID=7054 RepID=A0A1Y1MTE8_PHOPY|nr:peptidoglycan-recognition protein SB1-like [Photinus pyralis]XP_031345310.1 peptidoglycan-recognition protein SB1-like [Photinus pyralis]XP_031354145.1 peptidoglycan-recognition protein SB1-like [Photinus pyralis]KAB0802152.1 hypothetical protein PPYR_04338 [Photinus pyralis]